MPLPTNPLQAQLRYPVDVAAEVSRVRERLLKACRRDRFLREVDRVLRGDLMEAVVFKRVCAWLESLPAGEQTPDGTKVRQQILYQVSRELTRQHLGHMVNALAKACVTSPSSPSA